MEKKVIKYKKNITEIKKEPVAESKTSSGSGKNNILFVIGGFILLVVMFLSIPSKLELIKYELNIKLFYFILLICFSLYIVPTLVLNTEKINIVYKTIFLICFSIILVPIFYTVDLQSPDEIIMKFYKYQMLIRFFILPTLIYGITLLILNKEKLNNLIEKKYLKKSESKDNQEETLVANDNLFTKISGKVKSFGTTNIILALFFIILSSIVYFYKLDAIDLYSDEAEVVRSAYGYTQSGSYDYWNFLNETQDKYHDPRAIPHLFLVSLAYDIWGISNWSTRFFSAFFGVIFIVLTFLITNFFTKNKIAAALVALNSLLVADYMLLFRWGRMYAMLMPVFLLVSFFIYKAITEENTIDFKNSKINNFIKKYFNFNLIYAILSLPLIWLIVEIHLNALMIFIIAFFFVVYLAISKFNVKYIILLALGLLGIGVIYALNVSYIRTAPPGVFSFFGVNNSLMYSQIISSNSISFYSSLVVIALSFVSLFFIKNNAYRNKYVFYLLNILIAFLLFSFIFNYPISFRYICFIVFFSIILIINFLSDFLEALFSKAGKIIVIMIIVSASLFNFYSNYSNNYIENKFYPMHPSVAYKTIVDNSLSGDALFDHWGVRYYFRGINPDVTEHLLGEYVPYPFDSIYNKMINYNRGWVTWDTHNSSRIDSSLQVYCSLYFKKYHGTGVDTTNVEVYFFDSTMLKTKEIFLQEINTPNANLNLKHSFTLSFWIQINEKIENQPFFIKSDTTRIIRIRPTINKKGVKFKYSFEGVAVDSVRTPDIADNKLHHIVFYQNIGKDKFGIFVDSKFIDETNIPEINDSLVKFLYNFQSTEYINNIRIFLKILKPDEINILYNNGVPINQEAISVNDYFIDPDFFWFKHQ